MLSAQSYKRLLKNVRVVGSGRPYGTMVLWYYGTMVLWYYGTMVLWYYGTMVLWYYGTMVLWYYGTMVLWYYGTMVLWYYGTMVLWYYGTMVLWYYGTMVLWYYGTMVLWYYGTMVLWYYGTMVLWYYGTMVLWYYGTMVLWYYGTMVLWYYGTMVLWYYGTMAELSQLRVLRPLVGTTYDAYIAQKTATSRLRAVLSTTPSLVGDFPGQKQNPLLSKLQNDTPHCRGHVKDMSIWALSGTPLNNKKPFLSVIGVKRGEIRILLRIPRVKYRVIKYGFGRQKVRQKVQKYKVQKVQRTRTLPTLPPPPPPGRGSDSLASKILSGF